jgi:hypothetical protein
MKYWKKTYQDWYMTMDSKPRGKDRRLVNRITRSKLKQELQREVKTSEPSSACQDEQEPCLYQLPTQNQL